MLGFQRIIIGRRVAPFLFNHFPTSKPAPALESEIISPLSGVRWRRVILVFSLLELSRHSVVVTKAARYEGASRSRARAYAEYPSRDDLRSIDQRH
jgi:hypothetical protein